MLNKLASFGKFIVRQLLVIAASEVGVQLDRCSPALPSRFGVACRHQGVAQVDQCRRITRVGGERFPIARDGLLQISCLLMKKTGIEEHGRRIGRLRRGALQIFPANGPGQR